MDSCPNFRDVGATINVFAGRSVLREGALLRGGKIDFVDDARSIGNPRFILNLRRGPDPDLNVPSVQIAADDRQENYESANPAVRRWLTRVLDQLADAAAEPPILIHCAAGRDRTGVVVAAVLASIGVPDDLIVADYLMTDGSDESRIRTALAGFGDLQRYRRVLGAKFIDPAAAMKLP